MTVADTCPRCGGNMPAADRYLSLTGATVCRICHYAEQTQAAEQRVAEALEPTTLHTMHLGRLGCAIALFVVAGIATVVSEAGHRRWEGVAAGLAFVLAGVAVGRWRLWPKRR